MENQISLVNSQEIDSLRDQLYTHPNTWVAQIDGSRVTTWPEYTFAIQESFRFPASITDGLISHLSPDGYLDWMRDLDWLDSSGYALIINHSEDFMSSDPHMRIKIMARFEDIILPYWQKDVERCMVGGKPKPFNVYLVDDRSTTGGEQRGLVVPRRHEDGEPPLEMFQPPNMTSASALASSNRTVNQFHCVSARDARRLRKQLCRRQDMWVVTIDGREVPSCRDFTEVMARNFHFPIQEYEFERGVGYNTYLDWIRDLSWLDYAGFVIIIEHFADFMSRNSDNRNMVLMDFEDRVFPWWQTSMPWYAYQGKTKPFNVYIVD